MANVNGTEINLEPTAGMRVQARLLARNASPFTLDDEASIRAMLRAARPRSG